MPDSVLINGKGRFDCTKKSDPNCIPNAPYEVFDVNVLQSYRLRYFYLLSKIRIINTGAMGSYNFSIDGHTLDVIEADGQPTIRRKVDILRIGVGQRCNSRFCLISRFCNCK